MTCVERLEEYEEKLIKEHGAPSDRVVTVSGLVGVGSSTVADILSDELGFEHVSSGKFFRRKAEEKDMELTEFFDNHRSPEGGPDPDLMWDRRALNLAYTKNDLILEGRMTGPLLCDIAEVRVLVRCDEKVAAERLAKREDLDPRKALKVLRKRNSQDIKTYRQKYGIDVKDEKYYNVVVDNSGSLEETRKDLLEKVKDRMDD